VSFGAAKPSLSKTYAYNSSTQEIKPGLRVRGQPRLPDEAMLRKKAAGGYRGKERERGRRSGKGKGG
jgi:hypothetical protein